MGSLFSAGTQHTALLVSQSDSLIDGGLRLTFFSFLLLYFLFSLFGPLFSPFKFKKFKCGAAWHIVSDKTNRNCKYTSKAFKQQQQQDDPLCSEKRKLNFAPSFCPDREKRRRKRRRTRNRLKNSTSSGN